jgi:hypothetical protein
MTTINHLRVLPLFLSLLLSSHLTVDMTMVHYSRSLSLARAFWFFVIKSSRQQQKIIMRTTNDNEPPVYHNNIHVLVIVISVD